MRTTVDIPDAIYRELKTKAASEGKTIRELVLFGVNLALKPQPKQAKQGKFVVPAIKSKNPGSLKLGPEGVYEYIPFP